MRSLDKDQLRRLKLGMSDPIDGEHEPLTIRKAYASAVVEMIERRERVMMDFVCEIEAAVQNGRTDQAAELCKAFWLSQDKWQDAESEGLLTAAYHSAAIPR